MLVGQLSARKNIGGRVLRQCFFLPTGLFFFLASTPEKRRDDREIEILAASIASQISSLCPRLSAPRDLGQQALNLASR